MKTTYKVGQMNGVPIIIVVVNDGNHEITRPLTPTELKLLVEELNEKQP